MQITTIVMLWRALQLVVLNLIYLIIIQSPYLNIYPLQIISVVFLMGLKEYLAQLNFMFQLFLHTIILCCCWQAAVCVTPQTAAHQALRLWDSPGKNTGVGCHFLSQCMKVKSESEVAQSCLTLQNPMVDKYFGKLLTADSSSSSCIKFNMFQLKLLLNNF